MKRLFLTLFAVVAALFAVAQEEIAVEQIISGKIEKLEIEAGWKVKVLNQVADTCCSIAIVTTEEYLEKASQTKLCKLSGKTLTILENNTLPKGTVVELRGKTDLKSLYVDERADVFIDSIGVAGSKRFSFDVAKLSSLHIGHLHTVGQPVIQVSDAVELQIDTLTGDDLYVWMDDCKFRYGVNLLNGNLNIWERKLNYFDTYIPEGQFVNLKRKWQQNDTLRHLTVSKGYERLWNGTIIGGLKGGYRFGQSPKDFDTNPYACFGVFSLSVPVVTGFNLSKKWTMQTGLQFDLNIRRMAHPVTQDGNGLIAVDNQLSARQNIVTNTYLTIPVNFYRKISRNGDELGLDVNFGRRLGGSLFTLETAVWGNSSGQESIAYLFNPWKIEFGISLNTNSLGLIHGVRLFTNLLPEFSNASIKPMSTIGMEIKL